MSDTKNQAIYQNLCGIFIFIFLNANVILFFYFLDLC